MDCRWFRRHFQAMIGLRIGNFDSTKGRLSLTHLSIGCTNTVLCEIKVLRLLTTLVLSRNNDIYSIVMKRQTRRKAGTQSHRSEGFFFGDSGAARNLRGLSSHKCFCVPAFPSSLSFSGQIVHDALQHEQYNSLRFAGGANWLTRLWTLSPGG